jgi:alkylation response protein AidB-like acyl-CoA dehydrogenase
MGMWRTDTATVKFDSVLITEDSILGPVGSAGQVIRSGAQLDSRGTASGNILSLARSFLMRASIEVCHQAMELLRAHGLTDGRLLSNYAAVLQIAARNRSAESTPLLYAERS